jgi:hypothetical protein
MTAYRILVTGSRRATLEDIEIVRAALSEAAAAPLRNGRSVVVVQGECSGGGVDLAAKVWATTTPGVECEGHWAKWGVHGRGAGPIRNAVMVGRGADICLAFPRADSRGTKDCIEKAEAAGIPVKTVPLDDLPDPAASIQRCEACGQPVSIVS